MDMSIDEVPAVKEGEVATDVTRVVSDLCVSGRRIGCPLRVLKELPHV